MGKNRKNTFLLKRSNVSGKTPNPSDLELGEMALNLKDSKLYVLETTNNTVREIGWDKLDINGDGSNLTGVVNSLTNVGNGINLVSGVDGELDILSVSGDTNGKIIVSEVSDTLEIDINEPNLDLWGLVVKGNTLISGGATFLSGLTFTVSELKYIISDTIYTAEPSTITISSGDTQYDRIDVLVADISGNTGVVEGVPSLNPVKPEIDLGTQVEITFVTVNAGQLEPEINTLKLYDENLGSSNGEWDLITTSPNINGDSSNDSFSGVKSIEFTNTLANEFFTLSSANEFDIGDNNVFTFYIKNKVKWPNRHFINISFLDINGNVNGVKVKLDNNKYGFSHSNTSSWQVVSISLGDFQMSSNLIKEVKFEVEETNTANGLNLYIDLVRFQSGAPTVTAQNIWLSFKGDDNNVAIAQNNTEQMYLSGGNNITTTIPDNNTVRFDLDDDITLNSISATTLYGDGSNLTGIEDVKVSGFTYDGVNTFNIEQTDGSNYSATIDNLIIEGTFSASTYSGLSLNDLNDVNNTIPENPDNTYQGRQLYFDVTTNKWISSEEYGSLGTVTIWGKKGSAGTISKGLPVYITGFDNDLHQVELANSTDSTKIPVIGFTAEDFDDTSTKPIVTFGILSGIDTTNNVSTLNPNGETWVVNDVLYMSKTDGGLTKFRPNGSNTQIQRIAKILRVDTVSGQIFIFNTARTAGLPNLSNGYLWVGNGNDTPQEVLSTNVGVSVNGFTYNNTNNTLTITDNNGGSFNSVINEMNNLTINGTLSASTYENLPIDPNYYVTGGTFSSETLTLNRNDGNDITITGFTNGGGSSDNTTMKVFSWFMNVT